MLEMIVAADARGGIGNRGGLPWEHHKEDMAWFREKTVGKTLIMGRKTYESLPGPLEGRHLVVMSRSMEDTQKEGVEVARSMEEVGRIWNARPEDQFIVIGGAEIYKQFLPLVEVIYWTQMHGIYECDTYFPEDLGASAVAFITAVDAHNLKVKSSRCTFWTLRRRR